jgi:hypothetical protein
MSETNQGISRRDLLKRGAVVGGTVLWATPVVRALAVTEEVADTPSDTCVASWAASVYDSWQGPGNNLVDGIATERSVPANATGPKDDKFFSLGFGGYLILTLGTPYFGGKEGEAVVIETTNIQDPPYPLETAAVQVGRAGGPWYPAVPLSATNASTPALEVFLDGIVPVGELITHVKIVDTTNPDDFPPDEYPEADGFDVNAVGITCP